MKWGFQNTICSRLKEGSDEIHILVEPLLFFSKKHGLFEIPVDFETDFSSVPRIPIAYQLWGGRNHREGALHDYADRIDAVPSLSCMEANDLFLEAMESRGVAWYIRYPMYYGVVACNWMFYHKKSVGDKL